MRLRLARIFDFRNIEVARIDFSSHFTALVGDNGQGKTNTLEALYLASALRPLRNVPRSALLRTGKEEARIELVVERASSGLTHELSFTLRPRSRLLEKDKKRVTTGSYLGTSVAVAFTPDDLSLGKGSPEGRRRFLDRALLNVRPAYLQRAMRYQKAVRERNRILLEGGGDPLLEAFESVIAAEGAAIVLARDRYVEELAPRVQEHFQRIAAPAPVLSLQHRSSLEEALIKGSEDATQKAFLERLQKRRSIDRKRRSTSIGPHHDDLELMLDGQPVKERASQGQHRAIVLALKLAELTDLAERLAEPPVLLLDDMSSELDATRSRQLFETVRRLEGQVVLTSTEKPAALASALHASPAEVSVYRVEGGRLSLG